MMRYTLIALFALASLKANAQSAFFGQIIDKETGEPMIGAQIYIEELAKGTVTDLDGMFNMDLKDVSQSPFNIRVSYMGYQTQTYKDFKIPDFDIVELNVVMEEEAGDVLEEVVVEQKVINDNEFAMLRLQKNANTVQDGISRKQIERQGATNAAESMKQVVGATVEDNKYVVMRGLGDRYSTTQLNGMQMVSTDPNRNASAMDLVPSSMIENIVTAKTFTPDQPGNFTGGNVNITTKSIPLKFYVNTTFSMSFNPYSSFNSDFKVDPAGGGLDGFFASNKSREMPEIWKRVVDNNVSSFNNSNTIGNFVSNGSNLGLVQETQQAFKNDFTPIKRTSFTNWSFSTSAGDRKPSGENHVFGYNVGLSARNSFKNYQNYSTQAHRFNSVGADLQTVSEFYGDRFKSTKRISGFGAFAWQYKKNTELEAKAIMNNTAEEETYDLVGRWDDALSLANPEDSLYTKTVNFIERQQLVYQLSGKHVFANKSKLSATASFTNSKMDQPDLRMMAYVSDGQNFGNLRSTTYDEPLHLYRYLQDYAADAKVDYELNLGQENKGNKLKFGGLTHYKTRDYSEYRFELETPTYLDSPGDGYLSFSEANGNTVDFFAENNMGFGFNENNQRVVQNLFYNNSQNQNFYKGTEVWYAAYAMGIYNINDLKIIGGLRTEYTDLYTKNRLDTEGSIKRLDLLPSLNMVYSLDKKSNLRFGANRTLARPNLREMTPMESFDLIGGFIYSGNENLKPTQINNLDLRYEFFPNPGEIIAFSPFFKHFRNAIVQSIQAVSSIQNLQPVNIRDAYLAGVELEYRKRLETVWGDVPFVRNLSVNTNFSYIYSRVPKEQQEMDANEGLGVSLPSYRTFQSQSPFIFNLAISYINDSIGLEATATANFWGERLSQNGIAGTPDVFEMQRSNPNNTGFIPAPTFNFVVEYRIFENLKGVLQLRNLFNPYYTRFTEHEGKNYIFEKYRLGPSYGLKLKYEF